MRACNVHRRDIAASPAEVGALIDTLASHDDRLWPIRQWPAMRFDRPLSVGAAGGHGPIRYTVEAYEPSESITFRITGPNGFSGTHSFEVAAEGSGAVLTHTIDAEVTPAFAPKWVVAIQPLHDALMEDALDNAERASTGTVAAPAVWSWRTRLLRRAFRPRR